jgi:hypothetical protein
MLIPLSSCAGLTRASMLPLHDFILIGECKRRGRMDCRVKPGNDDVN